MMKSITQCCAVCLLAFSQYGCWSNSDAGTSVLATFDTVASGRQSLIGPYGNKTLEVYRDQAALDAALTNYTHTGLTVDVNFATDQVFLVDMGQRNSGGYSVDTLKVEETEDAAVVTLQYSTPGSGCIVDAALSSPYVFVRVTSRKEILFSESLVVQACG